MSSECCIVFHTLKALVALHKINAIRMFFRQMLLERMFVAKTFVTKRTLWRNLFAIRPFGLTQHAVFIESRRNTATQLAGKWNSKQQM
jgi:hypothetical protein